MAAATVKVLPLPGQAPTINLLLDEKTMSSCFLDSKLNIEVYIKCYIAFSY